MSSSTASSAPLAAELSAFQKTFRSGRTPDFLEKMDASSAALAARYSPSPLPLGATMPSFSLPNVRGDTVSLASMLDGRSALVVSFYRGGWCPYCNIALRTLTKSVEQFNELGAGLVCISPETPDETLTTKEKNELKFEVLSDDGLAVAEKMGVAFTVGDDVKELYKSFGVDLDALNGNKGVRKAKLPLPATFVVDKDGKVVYSFANLDYTKRAEPAEIIAAIKGIKA